MESASAWSDKIEAFFAMVASAFLCVLGVVSLVFGLEEAVLANASPSWPVADGTILCPSVFYGDDGEEHRAAMSYKYAVDGKDYQGWTIVFGDSSGDISHARKMARRYPEGMAVKVHYLPSSPGTCVLEPGMRLQLFFCPVGGLILLLLGISTVLVLFRKLTADKKSLTMTEKRSRQSF